MKHVNKTTYYVGLKNDSGTIEKSEVIEFINLYVDAGNFTEGTALWNDELENCLIFECVEIQDHLKLEEFDASIEKTALKTVLKQKLETRFKQDSVLITDEMVGAMF